MNNKVKIKYRKPLLELCDPNKKIETVLTDRTQMSAYEITLSEKVNETAELTFKMPFNNKKLTSNDCEKLVKMEGQYYVIKSVTVSDYDSRVINVNCVHESVELKGILCSTIDVIGVTVEEMFNSIMESVTSMEVGYIFKGTDIPDTTRRALQNDSEVSIYENLIAMAEVFQACLEFGFDVYGNKTIYLRKNPLNKGKYVKKKNGLKQLDITYDSNELFTKVIAFGETDSDGVELNIMGVNPTGKSYVENYDYFLAKGMTMEEIKANPRCNQEMVYRNTDIVDENDLYRLALEELKKCSVPVLVGSIDMIDFSVFEGSSLVAPVINEEITVIDQDINFSISARITAIERNYDNPLQTKVTISNVVEYKSVFKELVSAGEKVDQITTVNPSTGKTSVIAGLIQGKINSAVTQIGTMLDAIDAPEADYAILFEDRRVGSPLYGALAIGTSGILIAHELKEDNTWNWATAINSLGVNASQVVTGTLWANLIKAGILSDVNNTTWINMEDGTFSFANEQITFDGDKLQVSIDGKPIEEVINDATFSVISNREHCQFVLDEDGTPSKNTEFIFEFKVKRASTTGEVPCVIKDVALSNDDIEAEWTNFSNTVKLKADTDRVFANTEGSMDVTIETPYGDISKTVYWNTVVNGIDASYVEILASSQVFFMNNNETEYTPDNITLTPIMVLCEYISWSYSMDGNTWNEVVSGENGLVVDESTGELTIASSSELFTDTEDSITFKISCTENSFDITTVVRLKDGDDAFSVLLDNENHTFVGNYEGYAIKDSIDIALIGFVGRLQVPLTIGNIYQIPNGMTCEIIDNNTIAPTLRVSVDTTFTTKNGTIIIPVTGIYEEVEDETVGDDMIVGDDTPLGGKRAKVGLYLEKAFSYSLSLDGTPASNVKITGASNTFLSGDGGRTYTPTTLTFKGVFTECSFGKWQYWNVSKGVYEDAISGISGLTLSNESLTVNVNSPLFNEKGGCITLRLLSNIDGVHDIITVNKFTQIDDLDVELENIRSEIVQSNHDWKATFTTTNSNNLLFDGDFQQPYGNWYWYTLDSECAMAPNVNNAYPFYDDAVSMNILLNGDNETGIGYGIDLQLKPNTDYVYQAYIYIEDDTTIDTNDSTPLSFWTWTGDTPCDLTKDTSEILDYSQVLSSKRYNLCYVHFKTKDVKESIKCRLFIKGQTNTGTFGALSIRQVCFRERDTVGKYEGNSNEVVAGITTIDMNGITVEHTEHETKTQMKADGFFITDKNGEVVAELSNTEQWTQLKADKVFAKNIENVYEGSSNLYVKHAYAGDSDGSSEKPFKSFADLQKYLELTPIINKDLSISVMTTDDCTETLKLSNLKGSGKINIIFNSSYKGRGGGTREAGIYLKDIQMQVVIQGAGLFDEFIHGALFYDCKYVELKDCIFNVPNFGCLFSNTNGLVNVVDFASSYCAVGGERGSVVNVLSASGNAGASGTGQCCRVTTGAIITLGKGSLGETNVPEGTLAYQGGYIYKDGTCNPTSSWSYPISKPIPTPPATNQYTQSFNWTSHKTYQYQWSNWGDSDCKQGSWGYGLRGGHMFFDMTSIRNFLSGTVLDGNTITLTRANSGGQSGGANVYINGSSCSSASGTPSYGGQTLLGTLSWGETNTFTLPKAIVQGLKNGAYNSLAVYVNSSASNCYLNIVNASITLKVEK
ncbi:prophage endopeptidase tail family protein [Clostridium sp.]|uniref:prophage endopeptidase tail family protein n=1 Tax=Clostridium sp. TaxID=1506 RepID=UPI001B5FCF0C|nr:prophage endopeptidase tail family protein [Clostridium sp.]MBP3916368.1 phage tail protein [Clostridium sp.]